MKRIHAYLLFAYLISCFSWLIVCEVWRAGRREWNDQGHTRRRKTRH